jgi:hypothetical protein
MIRVKTRVFLAMKNGVSLLQNKFVEAQPFISANKKKRKLIAKVKTLQEKRIVYEAIKI